MSVCRQDDGLWRAEVLSIPGCFVDANTIHEAISDIQESAAMMLDLIIEQGAILPDGVNIAPDDSFDFSLPLVIEEHTFERMKPSRKAAAR